jgi:hypothetical protein
LRHSKFKRIINYEILLNRRQLKSISLKAHNEIKSKTISIPLNVIRELVSSVISDKKWSSMMSCATIDSMKYDYDLFRLDCFSFKKRITISLEKIKEILEKVILNHICRPSFQDFTCSFSVVKEVFCQKGSTTWSSGEEKIIYDLHKTISVNDHNLIIDAYDLSKKLEHECKWFVTADLVSELECFLSHFWDLYRNKIKLWVNSNQFEPMFQIGELVEIDPPYSDWIINKPISKGKILNVANYAQGKKDFSELFYNEGVYSVISIDNEHPNQSVVPLEYVKKI